MSGTQAHPDRDERGHGALLSATVRRRVGALALAVVGGSLIGAGAFASWDASASALSGGTDAAAVLQDVGGTPLTDAVVGLLPGDHLHRYLDATNSSGQAATFTGTVTVTGDLAGHVTVDVVTCTVPWVTTDGASSCVGDTAQLGSGTPTSTAPLELDLGTIPAGQAGTQHIRCTLTLTESAPTSVQGATGGVDIAVSNTAIGGSAG